MGLCVSVVIPVYNAEKYLNDTLSDLINQSLREIEIICVDDGSTDKSSQIIKEISLKDPRVQFIGQKNLYAGVARNNGLDHAKGEYVIFLDADDRFEQDLLKKMYEQIKKTNADVCVCAANRFDNLGKIYETDVYLKTKLLPDKNPFSKYDMPDHIFNFATNVPWNKMLKREFLMEHSLRFQNLRRANDTYFSLMALFLADRITYVTDRLINYRIDNDTSLSGQSKTMDTCFYDSYQYTLEKMHQFEDYDLVKRSFQNRVLSGFLHALNLQTEFNNYKSIYQLIQTEGLQLFGLDCCNLMDLDVQWQRRDLELMRNASPEEYILYKSNERRKENDKLKADKRILKADKKRLNQELKSTKKLLKTTEKELDKIRNSTSFKLGRTIMTVPIKIKKLTTRGEK
jgi:glycosyltransferase involved in cell wall biosynthesis